MDAAELLIEGEGIYAREHIGTHYHWSLAMLAMSASTQLANRDQSRGRSWGLLYRNRHGEEVHMRGNFWSVGQTMSFSIVVSGKDPCIFSRLQIGVSDALPSVYFAGSVGCKLQVVYWEDPDPVHRDYDMTLTHRNPPSYLRLFVYDWGEFTSFMRSSDGDHLALYNILSQLRGCRSLTVCCPRNGDVVTVAHKDELESLVVMECFRVAVNGLASEPIKGVKFPDEPTTLVIVGGDFSSFGRIERVFATPAAIPESPMRPGDSTSDGSGPSPTFESPTRAS
jgi:hypothetical protein